MPMLNMRFAFPDHLIDLNTIDDLSYIRDEAGYLKIGALTRQRDIERSSLVLKHHPIVVEALGHVGHVQTRNRGSIGGSLCHLDPAAELPAVVLAIGGTIGVSSIRGTRNIPMAEFPAFYMTPAIEADEVVTEISLPPWRRGHGYAFEEFARRHGDFAVVAATALIELSPSGSVERASLVLSGLGNSPTRVIDAENELVGALPTEQVCSRMLDYCKAVEAKADPYASAEYRSHLAGVLMDRALRRALSRAQSSVD
jgi:carbon-monoxide dehydrogenase medium subunit